MTLRDTLESRDNLTVRNTFVRERKAGANSGFKDPDSVTTEPKKVLYYVSPRGIVEYIPVDFLVSEYDTITEIENSPHSKFVGA